MKKLTSDCITKDIKASYRKGLKAVKIYAKIKVVLYGGRFRAYVQGPREEQYSHFKQVTHYFNTYFNNTAVFKFEIYFNIDPKDHTN